MNVTRVFGVGLKNIPRYLNSQKSGRSVSIDLVDSNAYFMEVILK